MAFRFEKLTIKAKRRFSGPRSWPPTAAIRRSSRAPAGVAAGREEGVVGTLLEKIGANRGQLERIVDAELGHLPRVSGGAAPQASQELSAVLEAAQREAEAMKDEFVSTEHLLLALTKVDSKARSILKLNAITDAECSRRCRPCAAMTA